MSPRRTATALLLAALASPSHAAELELQSCELSELEAGFAEALANHPRQTRPRLSCDPRLQAFARARAQDMTERGYFGHVDPDNRGPNTILRETGFQLPDHYRDGRSNNVESLLGGIRAPDAVLDTLSRSSTHRAHLLGDEAFYAEQDRFGVAYLRDPDTPQVDIWVVIIARERREDDPDLYCTPAPHVCFERKTGDVGQEGV